MPDDKLWLVDGTLIDESDRVAGRHNVITFTRVTRVTRTFVSPCLPVLVAAIDEESPTV